MRAPLLTPCKSRSLGQIRVMLGYTNKVLFGVTNGTGEKFGNNHSNKHLSFKIGDIRYYLKKVFGVGLVNPSFVHAFISCNTSPVRWASLASGWGQCKLGPPENCWSHKASNWQNQDSGSGQHNVTEPSLHYATSKMNTSALKQLFRQWCCNLSWIPFLWETQ